MARALPLSRGVCASTARFVGLAQAQATAGVTDNQTSVGLATAGPGNVCRVCVARPTVGGGDAGADVPKGDV
jgi:hypothetical protein